MKKPDYYSLIDGGVFANKQSNEARTLFPFE